MNVLLCLKVIPMKKEKKMILILTFSKMGVYVLVGCNGEIKADMSIDKKSRRQEKQILITMIFDILIIIAI